jgi:hypothetical protein
MGEGNSSGKNGIISKTQSLEDKKLSSGCVNLEGYTYDIIDEFMQNDCPMYILPEDPDNYFVVKNGELKFGSSIQERYTEI